MSTNKKNWTDGEALTTVELQRQANIAATMDDRAWEGIFTPGATQKRILPLLEETASINPRLLAVPGTAAGAIKLQPCLLVAGGVALPQHINMSAKLEAALDSALLSSNSSGSTRYDLIYATISYATSVTGSRKVKDVTSGVVSTQSLPLEKATQVVVTVLPNVGNVTPTATMPADAIDGSSYNFPICYVAVANGYVSGSAHAQSVITPLWSRGGISPSRLRRAQPISLFTSGLADSPDTQITERWSGFQKAFGVIRHKSTTAIVIDNTIDWRKRLIRISWVRPEAQAGAYVEPTLVTAFGANAMLNGDTGYYYTGLGGSGSPPTGAFNATPQNNAGTGGSWQWAVWADATTGNLMARTATAPTDATNGDNWAVVIEYSDRFEGV